MKKISVILGCVAISLFTSCESIQRAAQQELEEYKRQNQEVVEVKDVHYNDGNVTVETQPVSTPNIQAVSKEILKDFPEAKDGQERWVVWLTPLQGEAEENFKIELIPGKTLSVDCNVYSLTGELKEQTLDGFGYPYYTFETDGNIAGTRMMCPEGSIHKEFVKGQSKLIDYNSQLPLVVYLPEGYELQTKTWSTKD